VGEKARRIELCETYLKFLKGENILEKKELIDEMLLLFKD